MADLPIQAIRVGDDLLVSRTDGTGPVLVFTLDSLLEFLAGTRVGDFDLPDR